MHWNNDHKIYQLTFTPTFPTIENFPNDLDSVVLAPGCFDLLHYSHIDYLQRAALLGKNLIVALNSDASIRRYKTSDRPIIPQLWRARQLAALACVRGVVIFHQDVPLDVIANVKPNVVVVGAEWLGKCQDLIDVTARNFGQVVFLPESEDHISTTALITRLQKQSQKE